MINAKRNEYNKEYYKNWRPFNRTSCQKSYNKWRAKKRRQILEALGGVCSNCGCNEEKILEVNHITGSLKKERKEFKCQDIVLLIGRRGGLHNLNLLCKVCNALDYVQNLGLTKHIVTWHN